MSAVVNYDVKQTAAEIRKALRAAFPGVKFSVTMSRGTGYGWLHADWTDGPTESEVRELTHYFQSSYFDGMDDGTHSIPAKLAFVPGEAMPVTLAYSCKGVNTGRDYSAAAISWARGEIAANPGKYERDRDYSADDAVYRLLAATSYPNTEGS